MHQWFNYAFPGGKIQGKLLPRSSTLSLSCKRFNLLFFHLWTNLKSLLDSEMAHPHGSSATCDPFWSSALQCSIIKLDLLKSALMPCELGCSDKLNLQVWDYYKISFFTLQYSVHGCGVGARRCLLWRDASEQGETGIGTLNIIKWYRYVINDIY